MSIIKRIYEAKITNKTIDKSGTIMLQINYENETFFGFAICAPEDMDFFSEKVGTNIALSRARIFALSYYKFKLEEEVKWKKRIYKEITNGKNECKEMQTNYRRAKERLERIEYAIKKEKYNLKTYLEGYDKALESIRRTRNKDKKD